MLGLRYANIHIKTPIVVPSCRPNVAPISKLTLNQLGRPTLGQHNRLCRPTVIMLSGSSFFKKIETDDTNTNDDKTEISDDLMPEEPRVWCFSDNVLGPFRKAGILQQDQSNKAPRVHLPSLTGQPGTRASNREAAGQFVETSTSATTANESPEIVLLIVNPFSC